MKATRLKTSAVLVLTLLALLIIPTSCEDEFDQDLRDYLVGYYDFTVQIFDNIDGELVYLGDQPGLYDINGEMLVKKSYSYRDMIEFYDGDVLMFEGENIRDAGNAIVFDIPLQEGWIGPVPVQIDGFEYWEVDQSYYHGAYLFDDESIEIGFSAYVMDVNSGLVMVLTAFRE